jgi:hypothetical protein
MTDTRRATTTHKSSAARFKLQGNGPKGTLEHLDPSATVRTLQVTENEGLPRILLIDEIPGHAEQLSLYLQAKGFSVEPCPRLRDSVNRLLKDAGRYDIVIVVMFNSSRPWDRILHDLQEAAHQSRRRCGPLFLCVTKLKRLPHLRLTVEQLGARLAYER